MTEAKEYQLFYLLLALGGIIVASNLIRLGARRFKIPAVVGFLVLGFFLQLIHGFRPWLNASAEGIFFFLADVGIIALLFRVGLEMNLANLRAQLRRATGIWAGNVLISGLAGYLVATLFGLGLISALIVAVAFTATSIGITVSVWEEANALDTPQGELFLDVAELDDISGVVFLAILLAIIPTLHNGGSESILPLLAISSGIVIGKLILFGAFCIFLSVLVEPRLRAIFKAETARGTDTFLLVTVGITLAVAALAGLLGFSLAIGAFFAGLVFSDDPEARGLVKTFDPLHDFFAPFFFIHIGMQVKPGLLEGSILLAGGLLVASIIGKIIGTSLPALAFIDKRDALLLGVSMVPRAEITMIIMAHGLLLGDWAVPPSLFSAMVLVVVTTSLFTPFFLKPMLRQRIS